MVTLEQLEAAGWDSKIKVIPPRSTISIEGWDKTGKTHLALTSPAPIYYIDIDEGTTGVIEKFQRDKEVFRYELPKQSKLGTPDELMVRFSEMWKELQNQINLALQMESGTLVIDTGTELYDICRLAQFGRVSQVQPHMYQKANAEMDEIFRCANQSRLNVVLLHQLDTDFNTGEVEGKGWKKTNYKVQTTIRTNRTKGEGGPIFGAEITSCRFNKDWMGMPLTEEAGLLNLSMLLPAMHNV